MKIFIVLRRNIFTLLFGLFLIFLILFSNNNLIAAKNGINLWWTCIVPSMFPFFIATELLNYTNITTIFGRLFSPVMRPLFNLPGEGAYAIFMGLISGSPVGAKVVSNIYESQSCTKEEAERMICFTNNSSPLFIIGTVGILLYKNTSIGILLFITHILSAITVGIILGQYSRKKTDNKKTIYTKKNKNTKNNDINTVSISTLGDALSSSISKSISLTLQIGGFIILFSVILSIIKNLNIVKYINYVLENLRISTKYTNGVFNGLIEITHGIKTISSVITKKLSYNLSICAFILGFGGISIALQVLSIISKYRLSIKKYLIGKIMQATIASFYVLMFIKMFPVFNFDLP